MELQNPQICENSAFVLIEMRLLTNWIKETLENFWDHCTKRNLTVLHEIASHILTEMRLFAKFVKLNFLTFRREISHILVDKNTTKCFN
jgi:hypothetical protein